jgi:phenylacetate-CoA ligase
MDEMAVHVERRPEVSGLAAAAAGAQLGARIKDRIGVSVSVMVMDPDSIERSSGKMRRIVDHRKR